MEEKSLSVSIKCNWLHYRRPAATKVLIGNPKFFPTPYPQSSKHGTEYLQIFIRQSTKKFDELNAELMTHVCGVPLTGLARQIL